MLIVLVASALCFGFLNGFKNSANIVATVIASRALPPRQILAITAISVLAGPFIFGVAVARTLGDGLIDGRAITMTVVIAGVWAAIAWNLFTWYFGIPSSSSHALVGGLVGAAMLASGWQVILIGGLFKILLALLISPLLGLVLGFLFMRLVLFLGRAASPNINTFFKRAQVLTSVALALSHGSNDAQKTMGIITLGLVVSSVLSTFEVPMWVILASAGAIAMGIASGGWRLIRTLGGRIYTIRPVHGFTAQVTSASLILGAALLGGPVSTTQIISSSLMGVGAAERITKVRWQVGQEMLWAWVLTLPVSGLVGALAYVSVHAMVQ